MSLDEKQLIETQVISPRVLLVNVSESGLIYEYLTFIFVRFDKNFTIVFFYDSNHFLIFYPLGRKNNNFVRNFSEHKKCKLLKTNILSHIKWLYTI